MRRGCSHETAAAAVFRFVVRRGGDQITQELRVNDKIRSKEVRVVAPDGSQIGVRKIEEARWLASQLGLDLVEVAPDAKPPVCRMMDYGKYKYEQSVRQREARKKQTRTVVKEVKFRPKIDTHDYEVKKRRVIEFLDEGDKVKITMMFRGREVTHPELGERILKRLAADVVGIGGVETGPKLEGRNMTMQLTPEKRRREADEGSASDETMTGDLAAGTNDADAATAAEE
ncbi:MAG: translation initiation factor IF-3 [Acidimicrobiia bacterium]